MTDQPNKDTGLRVTTGHLSPDESIRYSQNLIPTNLTDLVQLKFQLVPALPTIFVPGIMGSNLKDKPGERDKRTAAWRLNDAARNGKPLGLAKEVIFKKTGER